MEGQVSVQLLARALCASDQFTSQPAHQLLAGVVLTYSSLAPGTALITEEGLRQGLENVSGPAREGGALRVTSV
jgi:hypothetical protein